MRQLYGALVVACLCAAFLGLAACRPALAANPFIESAYLYDGAFDSDIQSPNDGAQGSGDWLAYRNWLNYTPLGAETDPGWNSYEWAGVWYADWFDCCSSVSWNGGWAAQQVRYGSQIDPIILSIGQMPWAAGYNGGGTTWNQALAWEDQEWANEAAGDATEMGYFKSYVDSLHQDGFAANSVIIRLGYEFDGGWNPYGNLNSMSNMPGNYIAAWQNIITAMRDEDATYPTQVVKGFLWNPTTGGITGNDEQIWPFSYYPGDAYVDYIGMDDYDYDYGNGTQSQEDLSGNDGYTAGTQPTLAEQTNEWNDIEQPRIQYFANFASSANLDDRNGYISGRGIPLVFGEWGLWQCTGTNARPAGGDNPLYIQNMYNWMRTNNVAVESYFEAPADGLASLSPVFEGGLYPNATNMYLADFGNPSAAPPAPINPMAKAGNQLVSLTWPVIGDAASYNIFRGTASGGEGSTPIKTGVTGASFTDTGLTNLTTYYYEVSAVNSHGESVKSNEAFATAGLVEIDCGGPAEGSWQADTDVSGGNPSTTTATIGTSELTGIVPPQAALQSQRYGAMTYTISGFMPGSSQAVTLYFVESYWTAVGEREFNVSINGTRMLTDFDIYASAGGENNAIARTFDTSADGSGVITISFSNFIDQAAVSAISITSEPAVPTITSLSETTGLSGDSLSITGYNLTGATSVKFGGIAATHYTVSSSTSIVVSVPGSGVSGAVTVTTPAGTATGPTFTYLAPTITSFTPTSGPVGTSVTINGTGLIGLTSIKFNGVAVPYPSWTRTGTTTIVTAVPTGATTGKISITTAGGTGTSANSFTVVSAPTITSLSETTGLASDSLTITGTNFVNVTNVKFGGVAATTYTVGSATSIVVSVPGGGVSGAVTVTTPLGTATGPTFTYKAPTITSFTPTSGPVGTSVTLTGTNLIGLLNIKFNGVAVPYPSWTRTGTTTIVTAVPTGATSGKISITTAGGTGTSAASFTVASAPTIISLSETSGLASDSLTITGTNLTGATAVKFGGVAATTFTVSSSTSIVVTVPGSGVSGAVTVTTPNGTATGPTFTYKAPTITSFTPTSGPVGTSVTITGTNLIGLLNIKFNGVAVPYPSWTRTGTTAIVTAVPTGATTGKISITTAGGTATSPASFTVK